MTLVVQISKAAQCSSWTYGPFCIDIGTVCDQQLKHFCTTELCSQHQRSIGILQIIVFANESVSPNTHLNIAVCHYANNQDQITAYVFNCSHMLATVDRSTYDGSRIHICAVINKGGGDISETSFRSNEQRRPSTLQGKTACDTGLACAFAGG